MSELNLDKPSEFLDYKLEPVVVENKDVWNVNLLRAPYENVTIRYDNVKIDADNAQITFNFDVIDTPDTSVYNIENTGLQQFAAEVLQDILDAAVKTYDRNKSTTDDSTESTD
jgi:hypothetical protein